jgi:hypothetical protein
LCPRMDGSENDQSNTDSFNRSDSVHNLLQCQLTLGRPLNGSFVMLFKRWCRVCGHRCVLGLVPVFDFYQQLLSELLGGEA